jgi:hypothetical protein
LCDIVNELEKGSPGRYSTLDTDVVGSRARSPEMNI